MKFYIGYLNGELALLQKESNNRYTRIFHIGLGVIGNWKAKQINFIASFKADSIYDAWCRFQVYEDMTK